MQENSRNIYTLNTIVTCVVAVVVGASVLLTQYCPFMVWDTDTGCFSLPARANFV